MGKVVKRIVLTGGPSAGKSSSLETINLPESIESS